MKNEPSYVKTNKGFSFYLSLKTPVYCGRRKDEREWLDKCTHIVAKEIDKLPAEKFFDGVIIDEYKDNE